MLYSTLLDVQEKDVWVESFGRFGMVSQSYAMHLDPCDQTKSACANTLHLQFILVQLFLVDNLDRFLDLDNEFNIYKISGILLPNDNIINLQWIRDHLAISTTFLSIIIEQFIWCPIVFGTFEIPISTLLNGGSVSTVKKEVDSKLNGLLVSNAKVWTLANVVIYNVPVDWRPAISNVVDILWQSIVSDVAADCGKVDDDVCEVPMDMDDGKDYAFYAEKSRL